MGEGDLSLDENQSSFGQDQEVEVDVPLVEREDFLLEPRSWSNWHL